MHIGILESSVPTGSTSTGSAPIGSLESNVLWRWAARQAAELVQCGGEEGREGGRIWGRREGCRRGEVSSGREVEKKRQRREGEWRDGGEKRGKLVV